MPPDWPHTGSAPGPLHALGMVHPSPALANPGCATNYLACTPYGPRWCDRVPCPPIHRGRGIVFDRFLSLYVYFFLSFFLSFFFSFFVSNITRKRLDRFAWHFQGMCGVTVGRPDSIFGQFGETARCRDAQHGDGVCCAFAPQLVSY